MSGSNRHIWQSSIQRRLEVLFAQESFLQRLNPDKHSLDGQDQIKLMNEFGAPLDGMPVIWTFINTGVIDYSLIEDPLIGVLDDTTNTLNGIGLEHIYLPGTNEKPPLQVSIILNPYVNKSATIEYISNNWEELVEPGLRRLRGGRLKTIRSAASLKAHMDIVEMRKTMKPREIAIKRGLTPKQVYDILSKYRKKTRPFDPTP